ncbi:hypothetical protein L1987_02055 [Smallanthus sonchifolius]|uniref:Uncharacterized protein n=1 Tax=Smallanthus sonchifolius TaxID=185202 RepID=A0ACB9K6Y2_9ASTR|nr:hypothetical protein L1987_02055 [Smallanthus sonchifolius]
MHMWSNPGLAMHDTHFRVFVVVSDLITKKEKGYVIQPFPALDLLDNFGQPRIGDLMVDHLWESHILWTAPKQILRQTSRRDCMESGPFDPLSQSTCILLDVEGYSYDFRFLTPF